MIETAKEDLQIETFQENLLIETVKESKEMAADTLVEDLISEVVD